jgi:hypothetical protein
MLAIMLSSHAGDDATEATCLWRDVDADTTRFPFIHDDQLLS